MLTICQPGDVLFLSGHPRTLRHHREKIDSEWESGEPRVGTLYADALIKLLGPAREPGAPLEQYHRDLALGPGDVRGSILPSALLPPTEN